MEKNHSFSDSVCYSCGRINGKAGRRPDVGGGGLRTYMANRDDCEREAQVFPEHSRRQHLECWRGSQQSWEEG